MKRFKILAKYIFIILLLGQIIFPIFEINYVQANQISIDKINLDDINFNLNNQVNNYDSSNNYLINDRESIFDHFLKDYLIEFNQNKLLDNNSNIKIIIEFKKNLDKEKRIEIINLLFSDYEILCNYDIINAVYLKVKIKELIEKESIIEEDLFISKIYQSRVLTTPVIIDKSLKISALNKDDYPNWWIPAIGAENLDYNGTGVKVAVLDTGIYSHPDLNIINTKRFIEEGESTDFNGHGTHVAGIIGSSGESSGGIYRGVAPGVSLIDVHVGNASGGILDGDVIEAIQWASKPISSGGAGADIISMSFGDDLFYENRLLSQAISNAKKDYGTIFVVSAGNSGPNYYTGGTPATHIDTISVGATDDTNALASFSSWGPSLSYIGYPDVVAPGVDIISTASPRSLIEKEKILLKEFFNFPGSADYIPLSGTSMSCPMVAGAIALLKQAFPNITAETARIALLEGANKLPNFEDNDFLKIGAGLINVSASLDFLEYINSTNLDVNNISKVFPDLLPVKPFDLLHFPGDFQDFNLTIISGRVNTIDLNVPNNISGVSLSLSNNKIIFNDAGINYTIITIKIENDANPGPRNFFINLIIGGEIIDFVNITLDIRLPEYRVLMESYHGLNDWLKPSFSFPQINSYEVMKDMATMNISTDYSMEYWQPFYNASNDNSILTAEKLAQYDLIVLQNPILPYSPLEIENLKIYFNNGGNILFLGTDHLKMCSDNLNYLFSELSLNTQILEENIINGEYIGLGTIIHSQPAIPVNTETIFEDVDKFQWLYGNTFEVSDDTDSIAQIDNKTVAVAYNGSIYDKGRFVGFGDLHWFFDYYDTGNDNYTQNHQKLLDNLMNYFFEKKDVSMNIQLNSEQTPNGMLNISVYMKNNTSNLPIDNVILNNNLTAIITNGSYNYKIFFSSDIDGIAYNNTFIIPFYSYIPYNIEVTLTISSKTYNKSLKILYYNSNEIPKITSLNYGPYTSFEKGELITLEGNFNTSLDNNFSAYISFFSNKFHNREKIINYTRILEQDIILIPTKYKGSFNLPTTTSGYGIFYIIPFNQNYSASNSPRIFFKINNQEPNIVETQSYLKIGESTKTKFSDTHDDNSIYIQNGNQGDKITFEILAHDSGIYPDNDSELFVSVGFFITTVSEEIDGKRIPWLLFPNSFISSELIYDSEKHKGSLIIPNTMEFSTIDGIKSISTDLSDQSHDYICLLLINVIDKEGASLVDPFVIVMIVDSSVDSLMVYITISIVAGIFGFTGIVYLLRRKRLRAEAIDYSESDEIREEEREPNTSEDDFENSETPSSLNSNKFKLCPFCGKKTRINTKFCSSCGKKFEIE